MTYTRERQLERVQFLMADLEVAMIAAGVSGNQAADFVRGTHGFCLKAIAAADEARDKKAAGGQVTGRKTP